MCFVAGPRLNPLTPGALPSSRWSRARCSPLVGSTHRLLLSPLCRSISLLSPPQPFLQKKIGPRKGRGSMCPHLPWAEMFIWAHFLPPPPHAPRRDPPAVVGDEILSWREEVGSRDELLFVAGTTWRYRPVIDRKAGRLWALSAPVGRPLLLGGPFVTRKLYPSSHLSRHAVWRSRGRVRV